MTRPLQRWGEWRLREGFLEHNGHDPFVDVRSLSSAEETLNEIFTIRKKRWSDGRVIKDLLKAIEHIRSRPDEYPVIAE